MTKWSLIGANPKNNMKHPIIEKYCDFAINLGINNEMDTELNMSPEGKLRRKALIQKEEASKYFEEFSKKRQQGEESKEKKLNLTLKKMN